MSQFPSPCSIPVSSSKSSTGKRPDNTKDPSGCSWTSDCWSNSSTIFRMSFSRMSSRLTSPLFLHIRLPLLPSVTSMTAFHASVPLLVFGFRNEHASRANPRISASFGLCNCAASRSFERTSPMTSSTVSPTTGRRVKPVSTTTARASLTVKCFQESPCHEAPSLRGQWCHLVR